LKENIMRHLFTASTVAMLWLGLLALPSFAGSMQPRDGWRVLETGQNFAALGTRLEEAIKSNKMGLVTQASASAGAAGQGITIPGNRVVGVYRNDFARRMLKASIAAGIEAPIRFYITENADQTATLSYKLPSTVFAPYFGEGGDDLRKLAAELDEVFAKIAGETVKP
jgi:uncharacterized protein (DUF302 family)